MTLRAALGEPELQVPEGRAHARDRQLMAEGRSEFCLFSKEPQIERRRACELLRVGARPRRAAKNVGREPMHLREGREGV